MLSTSKISLLVEIIKSSSIAFLSFAGSVLAIITVVSSLITSEVSFEPIKVPSSFSDHGYTAEITTTQVLDQIARINSLSTTTKETKNFGEKKPGDELSHLQSLPVPGIGGIDLKVIQELIQSIFGVKKERISGEITFSKDGDKIIHHVRIRQSPPNRILVDFSSSEGIHSVIEMTAIKIIEKMDPVVAASFYRWRKDNENSLRMIDEALRNDEPYDDNYALVGRAQIYIQSKKYELAQADLNKIFESTNKFPPSITTQSLLYNESGRYDKGLEFALKAKDLWPNNWRPFNLMGDALDGLDRKDEAEQAYIETIQREPNWWVVYSEMTDFHLKRGKNKLAEKTLNVGLRKFPDNSKLLLKYAEVLLMDGRSQEAVNYLEKSIKLNPKDPEIANIIKKNKILQENVKLNELIILQ